MQAISWCYNYSIFDFLQKFWNVEQEWGKLQKFEYFKSQKNVSVEIKSIFHKLWRLLCWLLKISRRSYEIF